MTVQCFKKIVQEKKLQIICYLFFFLFMFFFFYLRLLLLLLILFEIKQVHNQKMCANE